MHAPGSDVPHRRAVSAWLGWALLLAALALVILPHRYTWVNNVGTTDGQSLDSVGTETRYIVGDRSVSTPKQGDSILTAVMEQATAASRSRANADRRLAALVVGLPGAFLLGAQRRKR